MGLSPPACFSRAWFISLSRGAWVGSLGAAAILLYLFRRKAYPLRHKIIIGLLAVGLLLVAFPQAGGRLKVLLALHESSNAARIEGWKAGIKVWRHYPFLGNRIRHFFRGLQALSKSGPLRNRLGQGSLKHTRIMR